MPEDRQEARRIIAELARAVDRRLAVEVRELPGGDRLQLILTHGSRHAQIELPVATVLATTDNAIARNELRLRLKRATDTMLFKPMPDHRMAAVKSVPPPGGQTTFRSPRGRR
jgi:hypothetical protein